MLSLQLEQSTGQAACVKHRLVALSHSFDLFSADQRLALRLWLLSSHIFENISLLSDSFVQQVGSLLPLLPLHVFQQLSAQQVLHILPSLPADISPPYQKVVASRVLQMANVTIQDVEFMGACVCQATVEDLERHRQDADIFFVLKRNLVQCVIRGDLFPGTTILDFLFNNSSWKDSLSFNWQLLSDLYPVLPALGHSVLQSLLPQQLLPALHYVGLSKLSPAQASSGTGAKTSDE
ncbi:uncharacterized protein LOC128664767 [Bombina bombina]|uniref:uncharacterized protein LOC128664767 n=1 Tax=Bombina bombina TaxID=8345 RepID=UPI00235AD1CF|nr:uncharacterized protein LOC128664767 [Bombina bombina]